MNEFVNKYAEIRGTDYVQRLQFEGMIAAQIKTRRKDLQLSQQKLADLASVPKSTIGRIEAGITSPKVDTLLRISKALETPFIGFRTEDSHFKERVGL